MNNKQTVQVKSKEGTNLHKVNDFSYRDGVISFSIDEQLFFYKFAIECLQHRGNNLIVDCTKLKAIGV